MISSKSALRGRTFRPGIMGLALLLCLGLMQSRTCLAEERDTYIGEIRMMLPADAAKLGEGWMECDGRELKLKDYSVLFTLIGTSYGGDGTSTYNLPKLEPLKGTSGLHYYMAIFGIYPQGKK